MAHGYQRLSNHLTRELKKMCNIKCAPTLPQGAADFPHMPSGYLSYKSEMKEHYFNIQAYTKWRHQSRRLQDQARPTVLITSYIGAINLNNTLHKILLGYFVYGLPGHIGVDTWDIPKVLGAAFHMLISIFRVGAPNQSISMHTCMHYLFLILTYLRDTPDLILDRCKIMEPESGRRFVFRAIRYPGKGWTEQTH